MSSNVKQNHVRRLMAAFFIGGFLGLSRLGATEIELGKHIEKVKISGDFRLRQENFSNRTADNGQRGRTRQRYRLRIGLEMPFPNNKLNAKFRFATGSADQVSTNQSLDDLSTKKEFRIDRAFLEYSPYSFLKLNAGKMANPLWTQYSSDAIWDEDFSPEGFGQSLDLLVGPVKVFANALQMVVDEDSGNQGDQWEISGQIGTEFRLPFESRLRIAGAIHEWVNESTTTRSATTSMGTGITNNNGNRRHGTASLQNEFRVAELTGQYSLWVNRIPVALQGTYLKNTAALDILNTPKKADKGYQAGVILGKAAAKNSWELAYFIKKMETDSTVADVSDSDFGQGGTGRRGSIFWVTYNPQEWSQVKIKYFITKLDEAALPPTLAGNKAYDLNRLQVDFSLKF